MKFAMPLYVPGKLVRYGDTYFAIENILICKGKIMVKLKDKVELVDSDKTYCEPTVFEYKKRT